MNILDQLKADTLPQHKALEDALALLRDEYTVPEYVKLLARLYGYYRPWEWAAASVLNEHAPGLLSNRLKTDLLAADLRHFAVDPQCLPCCPSLPSLRTLPEALGSLYVLEGSTLGGQILFRHFTEKFALGSAGTSFFNAYGNQIGSMWRLFRNELLRLSCIDDGPAIVASARATFETMHLWLVHP